MLYCSHKANGSYAKNSKEAVMKRIKLFIVSLLGWFFHSLRLKVHKPDIKVGDVAINPRWTWVEVQNPNGRQNGNCFHEFGESVGIQVGGKLVVVAIKGDQALVSYESPRGQGCGTEAGNGTLFFVSKRNFTTMTADYQTIQTSKSKAKARILALLRESLRSESSSS